MKGWKLARVAVLGTVAWVMGSTAQATPLFDFGDADVSIAPERDTLGFLFEVTGSSSVTFDGIGMFDSGAPGLE